MSITQDIFGIHNGKDVLAYTLVNANGCKARVTSFGARLLEMHVPDKHGTLADVVLGFDALDNYKTTDTYFGATCGRYGNRIKDGRFALDGEDFQLSINESPNHLHGGHNALDKQVWDAVANPAENSVTFSHVSLDGDEGYPGELLIQSRYTLTDDNCLLISMTATTSKTTIVNLVHHSYWNVAGHASGHVLKQHLTVEADFYTPVDTQLLATGEVHTVAGTPFDFRRPKPIGADLRSVLNDGVGHLTVSSDQGGGYDHNWVLRRAGPGLRPVATLWDPASGRGLVLKSTEPGVQIYTAGYLSAAVVGKGNTPYCAYAGLTFETQKFPGSPSFAHFPSTRVDPGDVYSHQMEVQFFAR